MHTTSDSAPTEVLTAAYARERTGPGPGRRFRKRYLLIGLAALAVLAIGATLTAPDLLGRFSGTSAHDGAYHTVDPADLVITLTEDGELKPRESVKIKCEVEGQSTILFVVDESSLVKKGDLLVELTSDTLEERLRSKKVELESMEANYQAAIKELELQKSQNASNIKKAEIDHEVAGLDLKKYMNGDYKGKLEKVELQIRQSEKEIKRKERELKENKELLKKGWVTADDVDELDFALTVAVWQLEQHRLSREILCDYEHPKVMKQRESAVERAREELGREEERAKSREGKLIAQEKRYKSQLELEQEAYAKLEKQIEQSKMYAPSDGIVQYPSEGWWRNDNRVAVGERVHKGQTMLELPDTSQMLVKVRVHEADRHMIEEGLPCVVKVTAVPGRAFSGTISKIDKFVDTENRWLNPNLKEHGAEILLDETDVTLSPGESAEVRILIDTLEDVLSVPVQCVFTRGARSFVFVERSGVPQFTEVQIGGSNSKMVEIIEGVKSGDRVLMDADEQLLATIPTVEQSAETPGDVQTANAETQEVGVIAAVGDADDTATDEEDGQSGDSSEQDTAGDRVGEDKSSTQAP